MKVLKDIEKVTGSKREFVIFKSYDHMVAATDPKLGFDILHTGKDCDRNREVYQRAIAGNDDHHWTYGSESRDEYIERTNDRRPQAKMMEMAKKNLKGHLNSKEVITLKKQMMSERKRRVFSETQGVMSIPRVLSGNIDYFIQRKKKKITGIKVGLKGGLTCNFGEQSFLDLVSSLVITSRMLEFVGIPVELYYIADSEGMSDSRDFDRQGCMFPLKKGGERLNLHKVCMIGGAGHFRHHIFAAWGLHNSGTLDYGLGMQTDYGYEEDCKLLGLDIVMGKEFMRNDPVEIFNLITKQVFK